MKRLFFTFILLVLLSATDEVYSQSLQSKDLAIIINAEVSATSTPSIKLKWTNYGYATDYKIYKKLKEQSSWGNAIATVDSTISEWTDYNVNKGIAYEYQILGTGKKLIKVDDTTTGYLPFTATGYILSGIETNPEREVGTALLLIDSTMMEPLANEINRYIQDLQDEGWDVIAQYVHRTEQFDGNEVKKNKQIITKTYQDNPNLKSIVLIGRVAVPYSGRLNPDGHPDHIGAWPADIYYGTVNDDMYWTDKTVNDSSAGYPKNHNVAGDGKFDQSAIGGITYVKFSVGRIDFYDMPSFYDSTYEYPEAELVRSYLNKNHRYRVGENQPIWRGLIDDNFGAASYPEAFSSTAWRAFGTFFDIDSIKTVDWFTTLGTDSYLWAYGCGGGSPTTCGGIGSSYDFIKKPVKATFTMLFGSYFGDWEIKPDNFLRASIASPLSEALICGWASRPHWFLHYMNMGDPIGTSLILSQNNNGQYLANIYYPSNYPNGLLYMTGLRGVHIALMGDPTLKMYLERIPQPKNLQLSQLENGHISVKWEAPDANNHYEYFVYRAKSDNPTNFVLLNQVAIPDTQFEDIFNYDGNLIYQVKAAKLVTSRSGSFWQSSRPIEGTLTVVGVENELPQSSLPYIVQVYPNPARQQVTIKYKSNANGNSNIQIFDISGNLQNQFSFVSIANSENTVIWNLTDKNGNRLSTGVYLIKIFDGINISATKIIIY
jgi:hypothetical protein